MTLSDLTIRRPVLASVMSLLIIVAGAVAYFQLPVREYPDIDLPLVSVTTIYPGASPEVVEATITEPLEQTLNGAGRRCFNVQKPPKRFRAHGGQVAECATDGLVTDS